LGSFRSLTEGKSPFIVAPHVPWPKFLNGLSTHYYLLSYFTLFQKIFEHEVQKNDMWKDLHREDRMSHTI